eukprot:gene5369-3864_t
MQTKKVGTRHTFKRCIELIKRDQLCLQHFFFFTPLLFFSPFRLLLLSSCPTPYRDSGGITTFGSRWVGSMDDLQNLLDQFGAIICTDNPTEDVPPPPPARLSASYFEGLWPPTSPAEKELAASKLFVLERLVTHCTAQLHGDAVVASGSFSWTRDVQASARRGVLLVFATLRSWRAAAAGRASPHGETLEAFCEAVLRPDTSGGASALQPAEDAASVALMLLRGLCPDFPLAIWQEAVRVARAAFRLTDAAGGRQFEIKPEVICCRALLIPVLRMTEPISNASGVPPHVLEDIHNIVSLPQFASALQESEEAAPTPLTLVAAVFSDVLWPWALRPYHAILSRYCFDGSSRAGLPFVRVDQITTTRLGDAAKKFSSLYPYCCSDFFFAE